MASSKQLFTSLRKLEGAVNERVNPHSYVIRSGSPSLNFTFGNAHGLPVGFSLLLWGPPKGGKSLVTNSMIGQLHRDDDEAFVIKFNTEMREGQLTPAQLHNWGIDEERYLPYEVNSPDMIYDRIAGDIAAVCADGLPLKLVVIDSINDVLGRRAMGSDTMMTQQIGDRAQTNQDGLLRVLPIQRKYKFGLVIVSQQRAEMDMQEQMRGNKTKPGVAFGVLHHCEYSMHVERNLTKAGQSDLEGKSFQDQSVSRVITSADNKKDDGERTGHKIRVVMKDSSMGPKGRVGEFTVDYDRGIVNVHEEVFLLGLNRNIIEHPNNTMYAFGGKEWRGKAAFLEALRDDPDMQRAILKELRLRDARGDYPDEQEVLTRMSEEASAEESQG